MTTQGFLVRVIIPVGVFIVGVSLTAALVGPSAALRGQVGSASFQQAPAPWTPAPLPRPMPAPAPAPMPRPMPSWTPAPLVQQARPGPAPSFAAVPPCASTGFGHLTGQASVPPEGTRFSVHGPCTVNLLGAHHPITVPGSANEELAATGGGPSPFAAGLIPVDSRGSGQGDAVALAAPDRATDGLFAIAVDPSQPNSLLVAPIAGTDRQNSAFVFGDGHRVTLRVGTSVEGVQPGSGMCNKGDGSPCQEVPTRGQCPVFYQFMRGTSKEDTARMCNTVSSNSSENCCFPLGDDGITFSHIGADECMASGGTPEEGIEDIAELEANDCVLPPTRILCDASEGVVSIDNGFGPTVGNEFVTQAQSLAEASALGCGPEFCVYTAANGVLGPGCTGEPIPIDPSLLNEPWVTDHSSPVVTDDYGRKFLYPGYRPQVSRTISPADQYRVLFGTIARRATGPGVYADGSYPHGQCQRYCTGPTFVHIPATPSY